jgi:hypothetical protein
MASRDPKKEAFWRRMVQGQAGSGLSVRAWCCRHHLNEAGFYGWRKELARRDAERCEPAFVPVQVTPERPANAGGRIEIVLAGGRRIRVSGPVDRRMLADVLAVLEAHPC